MCGLNHTFFTQYCYIDLTNWWNLMKRLKKKHVSNIYYTFLNHCNDAWKSGDFTLTKKKTASFWNIPSLFQVFFSFPRSFFFLPFRRGKGKKDYWMSWGNEWQGKSKEIKKGERRSPKYAYNYHDGINGKQTRKLLQKQQRKKKLE